MKISIPGLQENSETLGAKIMVKKKKQFAEKEGFISHQGYRLWYRVVGKKDKKEKIPLLVLHGGPGASHDYLEPLADMAATGRRVIFYDQLGCGNSDQPDNPALWTVAFFRKEIDAVRSALDLKTVHILGQSWGGMLAMEYALTKPKGLASLVLANAPANMQQWAAETRRLKKELPQGVQETLNIY